MGIFDDEDYNSRRYGVPLQAGTPADWKAAYEEVMGRAEAEEVLNGSKRRGSHEKRARTILQITIETLTVDAVKTAYRKLVFKVHPDHGGDAEAFKEVHAAYSLLMDSFND